MADTKICIRGAKIDDIQGLLDCFWVVWESLRSVLPEPWVEDEIDSTRQPDAKDRLQNVITDSTRIALVAEEDGRIVGFTLGRTQKSGLSWLSFMGVSPTHRRRGIGKRLVYKFLEESRLKGAYKVSLNTAPELKPAMKLYTELGFVPEGLLSRHRYGVDHIIYSKFLE